MKLVGLLTLLGLVAGFSPAPVTHLNDFTFTRSVTNGDPWLVVFYSQGCGACKHLMPLLDAVPLGLTRIGLLDCTQRRAVCDSMWMDGYPTFAFIHQGRKWNYPVGAVPRPNLTEWIGQRLAYPDRDEPRSFVPPPMHEMVLQRALKQVELVTGDFQVLWERSKPTVILLGLAGVLAGIILSGLARCVGRCCCARRPKRHTKQD